MCLAATQVHQRANGCDVPVSPGVDSPEAQASVHSVVPFHSGVLDAAIALAVGESRTSCRSWALPLFD